MDAVTNPPSEDPQSTPTIESVTLDPAKEPRSNTDTQPNQFTVHSLTGQALEFLSTASNETIGACLVGLGAATYIVLGRVGLVLMGVVGGVVLHATWEGSPGDSSSPAKTTAARAKRRREIGLDVVQRALRWQETKNSLRNGRNGAEPIKRVEMTTTKTLDFSAYPPHTAVAMTELTDAVIRDYVKWWYSPVLPEEVAFPDTCQRTFTAFLLSMFDHLSRKSSADIFLEFLTHSSSILIVFLNEISNAINQSPNTSTQEAVQQYLESSPDSNLAYVVNTDHQLKKLDVVAEDILRSYLEHKSYNSEPVRVFLQQVLCKVILDMTIESCSRAEFINDWIVWLLDDVPAESTSPSELDAFHGQEKEENSEATLMGSELEESAEEKRHRRVVSKAQEAMDDAMQEAARLTRLIAEEDARRAREGEALPNQSSTIARDSSSKHEGVSDMSSSNTLRDDASESTNQGIHTPTSSQSDLHRQDESLPNLPPRPTSTSNSDGNDKADSRSTIASFTNFDQIMPQLTPTALIEDQDRLKKEPPPLTLHNANIVLMDDSDPSDRKPLRNKPTTDYLVQVEPSISYYPGWMTVRKINDFENLHQVLVRIAKITEAKRFAETHPNLPSWKGTTKSQFKEALERYLIDAVQHTSLAESDGMKRFLEKDLGLSKAPQKQSGFPGFGAIENVGKGVIDVLAQAPKGVAGGGKAIIGGVTGAFGQGRTPKKSSVSNTPPISRSSTSLPASARIEGSLGVVSSARQSQDSLQSSSQTVVNTQPTSEQPMKRRPSNPEEAEGKSISTQFRASEPPPILGGDPILNLPPPPSAIPDDYEIRRQSSSESSRQSSDKNIRTSTSTAASSGLDLVKTTIPEEDTTSIDSKTASTHRLKPAPQPHSKSSPARSTLTEQETQIAVELSLACITELYKLSSAWSVRLALLNAAKSILLRPGNAQLDSIRQLLQDTVLDRFTSDAGIAALISQTRANALPTEQERAAWPAERTPEQKEELRRKARRLLTESGIPQALNSVMGVAASGEALGKVFDALQVQKVARGVVFGVMLQALRAVTQ